jgi:hypothetical protein
MSVMKTRNALSSWQDSLLIHVANEQHIQQKEHGDVSLLMLEEKVEISEVEVYDEVQFVVVGGREEDVGRLCHLGLYQPLWIHLRSVDKVQVVGAQNTSEGSLLLLQEGR